MESSSKHVQSHFLASPESSRGVHYSGIFYTAGSVLSAHGKSPDGSSLWISSKIGPID